MSATTETVEETEVAEPTTRDYVVFGASIATIILAPKAIPVAFRYVKKRRQNKQDIKDGIINGKCKDVPNPPARICVVN